MDTDDLSVEAYTAIIIEAEKFNHDLTLQFGVLSYDCKDEHFYLDASITLINKLLKKERHGLSDVFFGNVPDLDIIRNTLNKMKNNIEKVKQIPYEERTFDF
jgi:hypothetical protein